MTSRPSTRVLVVDDQPQLVWMLEFSLQAEGFDTLSAADGRAALVEVQQHRPDVILLDIMMPIMDGWAVLQEIQCLPLAERPKVIVVSARSSLQDRAKAVELGADAFISKPFNVDELLDVVRDVHRSI